MSKAVSCNIAVNLLHAWALLPKCRMLRYSVLRFARASKLRPSTLTTLQHAVSSSVQLRCSQLETNMLSLKERVLLTVQGQTLSANALSME